MPNNYGRGRNITLGTSSQAIVLTSALYDVSVSPKPQAEVRKIMSYLF